MGLSHIVKLEGHESDDLGQLLVGVKGFEPSTSSSRTTRATPALHPDFPCCFPASQPELGSGQGRMYYTAR